MQAASEKYVAFLDSKTIPNKNWLSSSFAKLRDYDIVLGSVQYRGVSSFQKLISASIYGEDTTEHISGTLILKSAFLKIGFFNEKTRAGEDLDWRARVKESEFSYYVPSSANTIYSEISSNLIVHIKRAFVYQMHGAFMHIQHSTRVAFLSMFIILLATLAPSWNDLVVNYRDNMLFIPHILKFFLFFLGLFVIVSVICLKLLLIKVRNRRSVIFLINLSLFIWFFIIVYHWNSVIPVWNDNSPFYVPHITKIYLASILVLSFIMRGIIFPIKRGVHIKYLFPYRWVVIGLIGLILDISKSPGYFLGSLLALYKKVKSLFRV